MYINKNTHTFWVKEFLKKNKCFWIWNRKERQLQRESKKIDSIRYIEIKM
jgi:hypothetical protein